MDGHDEVDLATVADNAAKLHTEIALGFNLLERLERKTAEILSRLSVGV